MSADIVLIRHGETDWNIDRRYQGTSDRPLNETGMRQAQALADAMRGEQWDVMISSPLLRAWGTAVAVGEAVGISEDAIIPDPRLMERSYGVAEGYTLAEREQLYPGDVWEGLESRESLAVRSMSAIEEFITSYPNQRLALVTHGTWITSVLEVLTNGEFGYGKSIILNTSRTFLTYNSTGWEVGEISLADHLAALT